MDLISRSSCIFILGRERRCSCSIERNHSSSGIIGNNHGKGDPWEKLVYRIKIKVMVFFVQGVMNRGSRLNCFHRILLVTIFCLSSTTSSYIFNSNNNNNNSTYVERCRADCASHKDLISCGKFRVVRWLNDIAMEKVRIRRIFFFSFTRLKYLLEHSKSIFKFLFNSKYYK